MRPPPAAKKALCCRKCPWTLPGSRKRNRNKEILRAAIIAELDAVNLYEQMAALTEDADIKKVLLDIAREEKTHVGEFETMLLRYDAEQVEEQAHARKEIKELTGK